MIKFFRHIRQKLIMENKTSKYLKYAIGEIVLVVIGILIALQINNWNENRKFNSLKKVYIERLIEDLKQDTIRINTLIHETNRQQRNIETVITQLDVGIQSETLTRTMIEYLEFGWNMNEFTPSSNTYTDLSQTGNLNVFRNIELIEHIKQYYILIENADKGQNINKDWILPIDVTVTKETTVFELDPVTAHLFNSYNRNKALEDLIDHKDLIQRNAAGHYWFNNSLINYILKIKVLAVELINTLQEELKKN